MKYFALKLGPMQESGSALLRALQNESMIPLDLLVREAVQNSLDAALAPAGGVVSVDIVIRQHETRAVTDLFESGIDNEVLLRLFPKGGRMLEIRDKGTEGLTGPMRLEDVSPGQMRGNLLKLVYEVGRSRADEVSGGSWGLGKTCYFRIGVGLVLYYSRIRLNDRFEERLVACLVENEADDNRLQRDSVTGIAWWGEENGAPVTDALKIESLLRSIGVQPYAGDDTGTAVIIPFLRSDLIPLQDDASSEEPDMGACRAPLSWWLGDYESYLSVALQRWFCARIDNPRFRGGPALAICVNGTRLHAERMQPIFQVLQALYNRLDPIPSRGQEDYLDKCGVNAADILRKSISLNGVFTSGTSSGQLSAVRLTQQQLKMVAPDNMPDPYLCIFSPQERIQRNRPLVAFMRGPGMIIRWDNSNDPRGWGGGVVLPAGETYLLGLFIPEKSRELKEDIRTKLRNRCETLESYLRSCERSDHHQWVDHAGLTIISRIRSKAGDAIDSFNTPMAASSRGISLRAARNVADRLLPTGFGQDGRVAHASTATDGRSGFSRRDTNHVHRAPELEVTDVHYRENAMQISWRLHWGTGQENRQIALGVDSESGVISDQKWAQEGLGPFPLSIEEAAITDSLSSNPADILFNARTLLLVRPWRTNMDGTTVTGELTISMRGKLAGNLRPVLHAAVQMAEGPA